MKSHTYKRKNKKNDPVYTFFKLVNAVKVVRDFDDESFEHVFHIGDIVSGRTINGFDFDKAINRGHSVYATSNEFPTSNAQSLANQIDIIYQSKKSEPTDLELDISEIISDSTKSETEKEALIKARVGQGSFRKDLLIMWGGCAVTGCTTSELLIASHIRPWKSSTDDQRLDKFNGFLLLANIDKAFDSGLISFDSSGKILISPYFTDYKVAGIDENMAINIQKEHETYLSYHRTAVYKNT
ncbi:HNH endonuclease [Marichromatium purpuratum]|uniref:HNH endonuclease n=1 Tax=Marichromatium purpuratum TaxID=37487 RepID=UPI00021E68E4|nr:HNH endonuclease [Marichromatium purpuratum]